MNHVNKNKPVGTSVLQRNRRVPISVPESNVNNNLVPEMESHISADAQQELSDILSAQVTKEIDEIVESSERQDDMHSVSGRRKPKTSQSKEQ